MRTVFFTFLFYSLGYSQTHGYDRNEIDKMIICLNADSTVNDMVFNIKRKPNAHTIYMRTLNWVSDYYGKRPNIVLDTIYNKKVRIEANNPMVLFRPVESDTTQVEQYGENYKLEMNIENGIYFVKYTHQSFTKDGVKVDLKLSDIYNDPRNRADGTLPDSRKQYESNVGAFLFWIFDYVSDDSFKFD